MHGFTAAEVGRSRAMGQLVASRADRLRTKVNTEHLCNMSSTDYLLLVPAVGGAGRGSGPPGEGADTQPPHGQRAGE